jgi:DNA repair exonuclease SbcCD ATPase subunit
MLTVFLLILTMLLLAGAALWRSGKLPQLRRRALLPNEAPEPTGPLEGPVPEAYEEDLLEQEDLQWALQQRRISLEREKKGTLSRESAARIDAFEDGLVALEVRLLRLQDRMRAWKEGLLELEDLRTAHSQLQSDHLDLQYRVQSLLENEEELKLKLAECRREALDDHEEKESLRRQLAVLRNLTREAG